MPENLVTEELVVGGVPRTVIVRLPAARPAHPMPLIVVLHGNNAEMRGEFMRTHTTFDEQADAWGVAVAYPDGIGGSWADGRGVTAAEAAGVDDVAFLRALLLWSAERFGTTPDRNVVAGLSNGAFMAHRMALAAGDLVAVFASVAGALPAAHLSGTPRYAVSGLLINGTADPLVKLDGGYSRHRGPNGELRGRILSQRETVDFWRGVDRCAGAPTTSHTPASDDPGMLAVTTELMTDGVAGTQVASWTVHGGGHSWPAPDSLTPPEFVAFAGETARNFDTAAEICRFAVPLLTPADARRL